MWDPSQPFSLRFSNFARKAGAWPLARGAGLSPESRAASQSRHKVRPSETGNPQAPHFPILSSSGGRTGSGEPVLSVAVFSGTDWSLAATLVEVSAAISA